MNEDDCIFCKIVRNEIPSKVVYEDDRNLAFLDIYPILKGHTIVIPKNHYKNLEDIPESSFLETYKVVKKIAKLLHDKLEIEGYNVLQNNFRAAGQVIPHFHIHIIPREKNDKRFDIKIPRKQATEEELEEILKIIKK
ncbi:MAG: HIT family protein [Promethearchaeota archaeon]|nr:MAG: HIT family protein [Candidatus Lokiarchaeota archaeon]